jgi:hypothetical protein
LAADECEAERGQEVQSQATTPSLSVTHVSLPIDEALRGKVGTLEFKLVNTASPLTLTNLQVDRILLDNIAFGPQGQGLQVASPTVQSAPIQEFSQTGFVSLMEQAKNAWSSLVGTQSSINVPNWQAGVDLGTIGTPAPNFPINNVAATAPTDGSERGGNAGLGQNSFDDQSLVTNSHSSIASHIWSGQSTSHISFATDQLGFDGDASPSADGHAIQSQFNSGHSFEEGIVIGDATIQGSVESNISEDRSFVGESPVTVSDFNIGRDPSVPGSDGTFSDLQVLKSQQLPFSPFEFLPSLIGQADHFIGVESFSVLGVTPSLAQSEDQQNQNVLQHNLSFGSLTLSLENEAVKQRSEGGGIA